MADFSPRSCPTKCGGKTAVFTCPHEGHRVLNWDPSPKHKPETSEHAFSALSGEEAVSSGA
eukprot:4388373-Pyramimonas_sp.AAC.1